MKNLYISLAIVLGVIIFVIFSSVLVSISIKDIEESISESIGIPKNQEEFASVAKHVGALRQEFSSKERFLSLLISDRALEDVRNCFSDVINYARAESTEGVITSVERLHNALENIRIKVGFTPTSVF